jgi:hypothetical protein
MKMMVSSHIKKKSNISGSDGNNVQIVYFFDGNGLEAFQEGPEFLNANPATRTGKTIGTQGYSGYYLQNNIINLHK